MVALPLTKWLSLPARWPLGQQNSRPCSARRAFWGPRAGLRHRPPRRWINGQYTAHTRRPQPIGHATQPKLGWSVQGLAPQRAKRLSWKLGNSTNAHIKGEGSAFWALGILSSHLGYLCIPQKPIPRGAIKTQNTLLVFQEFVFQQGCIVFERSPNGNRRIELGPSLSLDTCQQKTPRMRG